MTIMGITARRLAIDLEGAVGRVTKTMAADPQRRIARLDVVIEKLPQGLDDAARAALELAGEQCPVRRSLHPDMDVRLVFDWS